MALTLKDFIKANIKRKTPLVVPVSHPERGFAVVLKTNLSLWEQWGWQEESWSIADGDPVGVRKVGEVQEAEKPKRTSRRNKGAE